MTEPLSLSELCREFNPDKKVVLSTFKEYGENVLTLNMGEAIDVLRNTRLSSAQLQQAEKFMRQGESILRKRGERNQANTYRDVADYMKERRIVIN